MLMLEKKVINGKKKLYWHFSHSVICIDVEILYYHNYFYLSILGQRKRILYDNYSIIEKLKTFAKVKHLHAFSFWIIIICILRC